MLLMILTSLLDMPVKFEGCRVLGNLIFEILACSSSQMTKVVKVSPTMWLLGYLKMITNFGSFFKDFCLRLHRRNVSIEQYSFFKDVVIPKNGSGDH